MIKLPNKDELSALDARSMAQYIAFAPFVFQATIAMKDLGILNIIDKNSRNGISLTDIAEASSVSKYGVSVLLDFALSYGLVTMEENKYKPTKVTIFLLHDEMSVVNLDFTQHISYQGLANLTNSIKSGKPEGLKVFGNWSTIYPHLDKLPDQTRKSWFAFDHFYSDHASDEILPIIFKESPKHIIDIGGNTGRFAAKCLTHDENVQFTIMDLPPQLKKAQEYMKKLGLSERFHLFPCDMLDPKQELPERADIIWMSQFLDCFSESQIKNILSNITKQISGKQRIFILETFWDAQKFNAASFSLNATSLYFTCFANGNSRMYSADKFIGLVEDSGLVIEERCDDIGLCHSLLICKNS